MAARALSLRRAAGDLSEHGSAARRSRAAVCEYYHKTPTHLWLYDLDRDTLTEIARKDRLAVFYTPALLVSDERLLVQVVRDAGGQILSMNLDGSDTREFTRLGEGLPYGLSLSPDRRRVAAITWPAQKATRFGPATRRDRIGL